MSTVKVETLQEVRHNGRDVAPGEVVDLDDSLVGVWLERGLAKIPGSPSQGAPIVTPESTVEVITTEEFAEMKADEQKAMLQKLQIEGDDSNLEKRNALYGAYLETLNSAGGANSGGGEGAPPDAQTGGGGDV